MNLKCCTTFCIFIARHIYGYAFVKIYNKNFSDNCNSHWETYRNLPNFLVWKLRESTVFFPVSILVYYENKTLANIPHYSNVLRYSVEFPSHRNQSIDLFFKTIDWFLQNDQECQTTLKWKGTSTWSRLKESNYTLRFFLK